MRLDSDPRMPSAAKRYTPPPPSTSSAQETAADYSGFLAIVFGVVGVMFRYKVGSWLALICCVQSLANARNFETDMKQVTMAMTFAAMGLLNNYVLYPRQLQNQS